MFLTLVSLCLLVPLTSVGFGLCDCVDVDVDVVIVVDVVAIGRLTSSFCVADGIGFLVGFGFGCDGSFSHVYVGFGFVIKFGCVVTCHCVVCVFEFQRPMKTKCHK